MARLKNLSIVTPRKTDEVGYRRSILGILAPLFDFTRQRITPLLRHLEPEYTSDDWADDLIAEGERLRIIAEETRAASNIASINFSDIVTNSNRVKFNRMLSRALGINVFLPDPDIAPIVKAKTVENANLINSLTSNYANRVATIIYEGGVQGLRASEIAKQLIKEQAITERKAKLIARDQLNKFNAALNREKQERLGVTSYIWRNSRDQRVRGNPNGLYPNSRYNHWTREGKEYKWDSPPPDGHPGQPINCRCHAQAVIDLDKIAGVVQVQPPAPQFFAGAA